MFDKVHEECGVFGIYRRERSNVASDCYYALYALQHRGQESCGIAVNDRGVIHCYKELGLVNDVFNSDRLNEIGMGHMAIGHVRYGTMGMNPRLNAQPMVVNHIKGALALAHNGALSNAVNLREKLELEGSIFHTTSDTEVISYLITRERLKCDSIEEAVSRAMNQLEGAYSLVILSPSKLIAVRDPRGFRPLCMGKLPDGSVVFASESCALDSCGFRFLRDVQPGEVVLLEKGKVVHSEIWAKAPRNSLCVFEYVYFARPDSVLDGLSVYEARLNMGRMLAKEHPVEADVVCGVPDSGLEAAMGYSLESGIPIATGFVKNRYIGRSFIFPTQAQRENAVSLKLNPLRAAVEGKRVVLVDDSIVRGTTCGKTVEAIRRAGAKEVHLRISSPPFTHTCYFGTDIGSEENLIANQLTLPEIEKKTGADTLGYISVEGLLEACRGSSLELCTGCFTGHYASPVEQAAKDALEA